MLKQVVVAVLAMCLSAVAGVGVFTAAAGEERAEFPSLLSSLRIDQPLHFCGEPVPLDNPDVKEALEKELLLALWDRAQIILWVKRMGRYMPLVSRMLTEAGLPEDLKYVAVVESALLPHIGSHKGAVGYWQFIRSTGLRYGLRIDSRIDERRNIHTSTRAAIAYFRKLYGDFSSWTLSAAAYNMGEQGLSGRIEQQKTRDYYNLYLPMETQRYLFKILAVKMILTSPQKYGFDFHEADLYPPLSYDVVNLKLAADIPVQTLAEAADTYFKTIKEMNPQIRGSTLVKGTHQLWLPKGRAALFSRQFPVLSGQYRESEKNRSEHVYVVQKGDYLSAIAERFQVPLTDLLRWNRISYHGHIYPGQRIVIRK